MFFQQFEIQFRKTLYNIIALLINLKKKLTKSKNDTILNTGSPYDTFPYYFNFSWWRNIAFHQAGIWNAVSVTEFPGVLSHMTAMQAGAWAVTKCLSVGWELSYDNFNSCLANLEMDY